MSTWKDAENPLEAFSKCSQPLEFMGSGPRDSTTVGLKVFKTTTETVENCYRLFSCYYL
jgi:hypothetical protein